MALRRIKSAKITTIALCPRGKNQMPVLYKADDGSVQLDTLTKASTDLGELLNVVYVPNRPDVDGDFADRASIKGFAHEFNRDHRQLDLRHDGKILTKEQAYVAESFIVAKGDERFAHWKDYDGKAVDLDGAWATVIKIDDPALREEYRAGRWNGVSMFGTATVESVSAKSADERTFDRMAEALGQEKESTMNPEQLAALIKAITDSGVATVAALVKELKPAAPEVKVEAKKELPVPVFKGDMNSKEAREAFLVEMRNWELAKAIQDGASVEKIEELFKSLDEGEISDEDAKITKTDSPQVKTLKRQLAKAEKRSNQTVKNDTAPVTKEADEAARAEADGLAIADIVNAGRGYAVPKRG